MKTIRDWAVILTIGFIFGMGLAQAIILSFEALRTLWHTL